VKKHRWQWSHQHSIIQIPGAQHDEEGRRAADEAVRLKTTY
jgi:hypothetical protein